MKSHWIALLCAALLSGCATMPLPDGSKIERLPAGAAVNTPALTPQEAQRLAQLNAQVLAEQNAARVREAHAWAWRRAPPLWSLDLYYGSGWYGWGPRHPRWSFGLGGYGLWPH